MTRNVMIAMVMTILIAIIIEGIKTIKRRALTKAENSIENHKIMMLDYVRIKSQDIDGVKYLNQDFSQLIFQSYMVYIGKMTHSIVKTKQFYNLNDSDDMVFFVNGITNERNRQTIKRLIKEEVNTILKNDREFSSLDKINKKEFNQFLDYAVEYIENELEFQSLCGLLARDIMLGKY